MIAKGATTKIKVTIEPYVHLTVLFEIDKSKINYGFPSKMILPYLSKFVVFLNFKDVLLRIWKLYLAKTGLACTREGDDVELLQSVANAVPRNR